MNVLSWPTIALRERRNLAGSSHLDDLKARLLKQSIKGVLEPLEVYP